VINIKRILEERRVSSGVDILLILCISEGRRLKKKEK
jgi:hypothetical protein